MLEDLQVPAVIHQLLHGRLHRLGRVGITLLDGHGLLGHADVLTEGLKLVVGLGDRITRDRRIGVEHVGLAGDDVGGHIGLQLVGQDLDVKLVVRLALFSALVDFLLLCGAGLHRDLQSAQVGRVDLAWVALLDHPRGTGLEHADEVDGLHAFRGNGERRDADIVLRTD